VPDEFQIRHGTTEDGLTYVCLEDVSSALQWNAEHTDNPDFRAGCLALIDMLDIWRVQALATRN
jgi:hypothetical protein